MEDPGFGMPTWLFYRKSLRHFTQGRVEHKSQASIKDLERILSNGALPIVSVAWQTDREIIRDIRHARVGHYMLVVGFEPQKERLYFLNPGLLLSEGSACLYSMAYQEYDKVWNGVSNLFIQPGSLWTVS